MRRKKTDKERTRRLNVTSNLKKYSSGPQVTSRYTIKAVYEKVTDEMDSPWFGCEILYHVQTQRRGISLAQQRDDRYLILLRKKESIKILHLIQVVCRETGIDIRKSWDLPLLRTIDLGDDDNEFILSFDAADYSWFVSSQAERDETVWILAQMCKIVCAYDVTLGPNVDMDLISYSAKSSSTLTRFPMLQELGNSVQVAGDIFSEEEAEAEQLLEELHWVSEAPGELLLTISKQSDSLNLEIIDFLLQWEDDSKTSVGAGSKVRDTYEVLRALATVDEELAGVDSWISEQIVRLAETQTKLTLIESESGALETSYKNLSTVQHLVETMVKSMSISESEERLLSRPSLLLNAISQAESLKSISKSLKPLIDACSSLQAGLSSKGHIAANISPTDWKHLLSMTAVSSQRSKLSEFSELLCRDLEENLPTFLSSIVTHPYLNDVSKGRNLVLKQFNLLPELIRQALLLPGTGVFPLHFDSSEMACVSVGVEAGDGASSTLTEDTVLGVISAGTLFCVTGSFVDANNDAIAVQTLFHGTLSSILPLLNQLLQFNPGYTDTLCAYYCTQIAQERIYAIMFKSLFKQMQSMFPNSKSMVTINLSTVPSYQVARGLDLSLRLVHQSLTGGDASYGGSDKKGSDKKAALNAALYPWTGLATFLIVAGPIVKREELFVQSLFHLDSTGMGQECVLNSQTADTETENSLSRLHSHASPVPGRRILIAYSKSPLEDKLDLIFSSIRAEVVVNSLKYPSAASTVGAITSSGSPDNVDGVECVAMLVVLQQYLVDHFNISFDSFTSVIDFGNSEFDLQLNAAPVGVSPSNYWISLLIAIREELLRRLSTFLDEQLAWIVAQRGDPKRAGASPPVTRLPTLLHQLQEMAGSRKLVSVNKVYACLCRATVDWVNALAAQNDKYSDIVKLHNYGMLTKAFSVLRIEFLRPFADVAMDEYSQAMERYVSWMISYSLPSLALVAKRLEGVGSRVKEEDLAMYIRRKDILSVVKELDVGHIDDLVSSMRKRLEKHCGAAEDDGNLLRELWDRIRDGITSTLKQLEHISVLSFQIAIPGDHTILSAAFKKLE